MNSLRKRIQELFYKISSNSLLIAIRQGLINMMPIMIIGSFAVLIQHLPIPMFQDFMSNIFGEDWKNVVAGVENGTIQIMAIGMLLSISYYIAKEKNAGLSKPVSMLLVALVSLGCWISLLNVQDSMLSFGQLGSTGLFMAFIVAISASLLFFFFYRHRIFKAKLFMDETDTVFEQALSSLEPAILTLLVFVLIRIGFGLFGVLDIYKFVYDVLQAGFVALQDNLLSAVVFMFSAQLFWFFGIHGNNVLESVTVKIWSPKLAENIAAVQAGLTPTEIFSKGFFDVFILLGGSGATFCLIFAILLRARKSNTSKIAKLSIPLALFNINETMIFGVPIVLNPFYLIPFLLVPVILVIISYLATVLHLVPVVTHEVTWTTPILIGGYVATGSIRGAILQLVNIIVGTAVYMPFVVMSVRAKERENKKVLQELNAKVNYIDNRRAVLLLNRQDKIGSLARALAYDLQTNAIQNNELFLAFQPQIDNHGNVYGCEALLRWNHRKFGFIPPPTAITIAEEAEIDDFLNEWIFTSALLGQKQLRDAGYDLVMSINISPLQLRNHKIFEILNKRMKEYGLNPDMIEIELTENIALDDSKETNEALNRLKQLGVRLAIDDFGMGHTSLHYMRSYEFNTVKLDGSIVNDILTNRSSVDIVEALVKLCTGMEMHMIAEVVETKEQRDKLEELGCFIYQGYYYSRPLAMDALLDYLEMKRCGDKS